MRPDGMENHPNRRVVFKYDQARGFAAKPCLFLRFCVGPDLVTLTVRWLTFDVISMGTGKGVFVALNCSDCCCCNYTAGSMEAVELKAYIKCIRDIPFVQGKAISI